MQQKKAKIKAKDIPDKLSGKQDKNRIKTAYLWTWSPVVVYYTTEGTLLLPCYTGYFSCVIFLKFLFVRKKNKYKNLQQ